MNLFDIFMQLNSSCSVYHQCLSTVSVLIIIYIISYKLLFLFLQKNMNALSEFSACCITDLHCMKSFLVLGTMLVIVTVEINRHEQCDSHDPASITETFLIWCSPWYEMMMDSFLRAGESPGLYLCLRSFYAPLCGNPPVCLSADEQILSDQQKRREKWRDNHLRL